MKLIKKILKFEIEIPYIFIICFYILVGCSVGTIKSHDKYFDPYIKVFLEEGKDRINIFERTGLTVRFRSLRYLKKGRAIGVCYMGLKHIDIDPEFWYNNTESKLRKMMLFAHEALHCVCFRGHTKKHFKDGCSVSIMDAFLPSDYCLRKHLKEYKREMFNGC